MYALENFTIEKDTPIPLYFQLKKALLDHIASGRLKEGEMLPTENEICDYLEVSRSTVRQAMSELVAEGYLVRKKGKGTFVSHPKIAARFLQKLETFAEEMRQKGLKPSTVVLTQKKIQGADQINAKLELSSDEPLIMLSRVRYADDVPMVYLDTYIPYSLYPAMLEVDFKEISLYDALENLYNLRISHVVREIEAVNATRREAELLEIEGGRALCLVKTIGYSEKGQPTEFSIARYRGDRTKFSVELYR
ncbi:MAG: GntR family transcriptional regulator [Lachnospiraceae bacterium]|jgi:GntR family transcriptional regulator|nr:GntR family transcriptional regulator [Lachnospiraceae bacterium]